MGGTLAANVLSMFFSPVITRLFTPENFGAFAFFSTIGSIILKSSTLSFDQAIIIVNDDENAISLSALAFSAMIVIAILFVSIIYVFNQPFSMLFNQLDFHQYSFLLLFFIFSKGGLNIGNNLLIRKKKFRNVAEGKFLESLFSGIIKIVFGFFIGANVSGLLGGLILGTTCAFIFIGIKNINIYSYKKIIKVNIKKMGCVGKRYQDFAKYNYWTSLVNHISQNMTVLFLSVFYTPEIIGFYALGRRMVTLPVEYLSDSFYKVYLQSVSEKITKNQAIVNAMKKATLYLVLIGIIPFSVLFIYGPSLFSFVFGQAWETSGDIVRLLIPGYFMVFINRPAQAAFLVLRKLKIQNCLSCKKN